MATSTYGTFTGYTLPFYEYNGSKVLCLFNRCFVVTTSTGEIPLFTGDASYTIVAGNK